MFAPPLTAGQRTKRHRVQLHRALFPGPAPRSGLRSLRQSSPTSRNIPTTTTSSPAARSASVSRSPTRSPSRRATRSIRSDHVDPEHGAQYPYNDCTIALFAGVTNVDGRKPLCLRHLPGELLLQLFGQRRSVAGAQSRRKVHHGHVAGRLHDVLQLGRQWQEPD